MASKLVWDSTLKRLAGLLSAGAALVSILTFAVGRHSAEGLASPDVDRLDLLPSADTAFALGDTIRFTALAADVRGVALVPSRIQWQTDDSSIAFVDSGGRVLARGPGLTTVTVVAGGRLARARVWVLPKATELLIPGDSVLQVAEGRTIRLQAQVRDARGHRMAAPGLRLTVADEGVAQIDSSGELRGQRPGSTTVSATFGDLLAQRRVEVRAVPASLTLSSGGGQHAAAGGRLPVALAVQVVSRSGRPVPQVSVRFDPAGNGRLEPDSVLTDSGGVARARWTLGGRPGRQRVLVTVAGIDTPLEVTAEADPLSANTRVTIPSDSLTARVMEPLAQPVVVQLTDTTGAALPDVPVTWRALDGGEVIAVSARSDSSGQAQGRWTLGRKAGRQRLSIQIGSSSLLPPRIVTAEARPGPATRLELVSGNDQKGTAGKSIPKEVVLRVTDSTGNPVGDVAVKFQRTGHRGADTVVESGSDGRVRLRWTLSQAAGPDGFTAELPGGEDFVHLTAIARPGAVDTIDFVNPPPTAVAGHPIAKLEIRVVDRFGNPVAGAPLKLGATSGIMSPARAVTGSDGRIVVRWTPGAKAGSQTLSATVVGGTAVARHAVQVSGASSTKTGSATPRQKSTTKAKNRSGDSHRDS